MAMRILLTACCERVEDNLTRYSLKYDFKNGRVYSEPDKFVPCVSCGKNLSGVAVLECVVNRRKNIIQELGAAIYDEMQVGTHIMLDSAPDLTGMSE